MERFEYGAAVVAGGEAGLVDDGEGIDGFVFCHGYRKFCTGFNVRAANVVVAVVVVVAGESGHDIAIRGIPRLFLQSLASGKVGSCHFLFMCGGVDRDKPLPADRTKKFLTTDREGFAYSSFRSPSPPFIQLIYSHYSFPVARLFVGTSVPPSFNRFNYQLMQSMLYLHS